MNFAQWFEANSVLYQRLLSLRPQMAKAAQEVYDQWAPGEYCDYGEGGICDEVANALAHVIVQSIPDVDTTEGGQAGDDHAWVVVYNQVEAYGIDIPPNVYE